MSDIIGAPMREKLKQAGRSWTEARQWLGREEMRKPSRLKEELEESTTVKCFKGMWSDQPPQNQHKTLEYV